MEEEKKEKGFVIKDKRLFDESGEVRKEESDKKEDVVLDHESAKTTKTGGNDTKIVGDENYPEVNFASFVLSLSTSAMYQFGDFPDPVSKNTKKNLPAAKQIIDILTMLQDKTSGNLDEGEKSLIDGILFELRMRYVKETAT